MNKNSKEYKNGFDAGANGPNETNTHFSNFSTVQGSKEWNEGNRAGKASKKKGSQKKANPRKK